MYADQIDQVQILYEARGNSGKIESERSLLPWSRPERGDVSPTRTPTMTRRYWFMLLLPLVLLHVRCALSASDSEQVLATWKQWQTSQVDVYQQVVDQAQRAYAAERTKADASAISDLIAVGKREARKPDKAIAIAAYQEVLRIADTQADAVAFFTALGQLDQVRQRLDAVSDAPATDLLGAPTAPTALPEAVQSAVRKRTETVAKASVVFLKSEGVARERFRDGDAKGRTKAVKELTALATKADRSGDVAAASTAWKGVLLLEPMSTAARTFFSGLGTLDAVLAALPSVADPLGEVPDPANGYAVVSLRGLRVLFCANSKIEKFDAWERALYDHCNAIGMVVTLAGVKDLHQEGSDVLLKDQQLVMLIGLGDATRGGCMGVVRNMRLPVVIFDVKTCEEAGLVGSRAYNAHRNDYTTQVQLKVPGGPLAAGFTGTVRVIDPPAMPPAAPVPVEKDPNLVKLYGPIMTVPTGAIAVAGLADANSTSMIAFDTGTEITLGTSKDGTVVTGKLPARRLGFWMFEGLKPEQASRLSRDFWRWFDGTLTWTLRGNITAEAPAQ